MFKSEFTIVNTLLDITFINMQVVLGKPTHHFVKLKKKMPTVDASVLIAVNL